MSRLLRSPGPKLSSTTWSPLVRVQRMPTGRCPNLPSVKATLPCLPRLSRWPANLRLVSTTAEARLDPLTFETNVKVTDTSFQEGDLVVIRECSQGKQWLRGPLTKGVNLSTNSGDIPAEAVIGQRNRTYVYNSRGRRYIAHYPTLNDYVGLSKRHCSPIYQKDAASIISLLDLPPNARVLEAGTGMGALTMHLARIAAHVDTVELRLDHYRKAQKFIAQFQRGHLLPRIRFHHGSLDQLIHHSMTQVQAQAQVEARTDNKPELEPELASSSPTTPSLLSTTQFDGVVLDLPTPWSLLAAVLPVLKSDHFIICYLPNLTQVLDLHQYILARPALRCRVAVDATWEVEWKEWEIHPTLVRNPTPHPEQLNTYWDEAVGKGNATDHPPNGASNGNRSSDNENPGGDQPIEPKEEPATHAWVCHPSRMPKGHTAFLVRLKKIETIDSKVKNGNREE